MSMVVTAHDNGTLSLFDFNSNKVTKQITDAHNDGISSMIFTNSGLHLITGSHDGFWRLWNTAGGSFNKQAESNMRGKVESLQVINGSYLFCGFER